MWENLRVFLRNIGPVAGEHEIGTIDGPGLYTLQGGNGAGKSTLLRALAAMSGAAKSLVKKVSLTHGSVSGEISIGEAVLRLTMDPLKAKPAAALDGAPPPKFIEMPDAIGRLFDPGVDDPDAAAAARLRALLEYVEVPISSARVLVDGMPLDSLSAVTRTRTDAFVSRFSAAPRSASISSVRDLPGLAYRRMEEAKDLVEAAKAAQLVVQLVALALEKVAREVMATEVGGAHKALELAQRARDAAMGGYPVDVLGKARGVDGAETALNALRDAAARARAAAEHQENIKASLGERPSLVEAQARVDSALQSLEKAKALLEETNGQKPDVAAFARDYASAREKWSALCQAIIDEAAAAGATYGNAFQLGKKTADLLKDVEAGVFEKAKCQADEADNALAEWQQELHAAQENYREAEARMKATREEHTRLHEAALRWDAQLELVSRPIELIDEDAIAQAEAALSIAKAAEQWRIEEGKVRQAKSAYDAIRDEMTGVEAEARRWREYSDATWPTVGEIVSERVKLPWLRVRGTQIELGYTAEVRGRLAVDGGAVSWKPVQPTKEDPEGLAATSTGELSYALLRLMAERASNNSAGLIVPWELVTALQSKRRTEIAALCRSLNLVIMSEMPDDQGGKNEELRLVKIKNEEN